MLDILTFGSVTLDIILKLKEGQSIDLVEGEEPSLSIPLGDKIPVSELLMVCGGGAANSAVGFVKQGFKTAAVGVVGGDVNRDFILKSLKREKVNTDFLLTEAQTDIATTNIMYPANKNTVLPEAFDQLVTLKKTLSLDSDTIKNERDNWVDQWVKVMSK